jgi:hypothetical protein
MLEHLDIFDGHLEYFTEIWDILWLFGTSCTHLVHFSGLGNMYREKNLATLLQLTLTSDASFFMTSSIFTPRLRRHWFLTQNLRRRNLRQKWPSKKRQRQTPKKSVIALNCWNCTDLCSQEFMEYFKKIFFSSKLIFEATEYVVEKIKEILYLEGYLHTEKVLRRKKSP